MAEKIFRPPKSLKKKKKLVRKNYIAEQTTNGLRCGKFTEPVPHEQNRPTQPQCNIYKWRCRLQGNVSASSTYETLLENVDCLWQSYWEDNAVAEITPLFKMPGRPPQYSSAIQMQVSEYRTILVINDRVAYAASHHVERGTGVGECIG